MIYIYHFNKQPKCSKISLTEQLHVKMHSFFLKITVIRNAWWFVLTTTCSTVIMWHYSVVLDGEFWLFVTSQMSYHCVILLGIPSGSCWSQIYEKHRVMISGLRREIDENCILLDYCAGSSGNSWPWKMGSIGCPETSLRIFIVAPCILKFIYFAHTTNALIYIINCLTSNDPYRGRTAPLTSKVAFYIFIQQI